MMTRTAGDGVNDLPDWLAGLNAKACAPSIARVADRSVAIATYCTMLEARHPRRTQKEWRANWQEEYGKPILIPTDGSDRSVTEIELVKSFRAAGWEAMWKDSWGKAPTWMRPWTTGAVPMATSRVLSSIRHGAPSSRPWDILAWREGDVLFVECKSVKEKFTNAELSFFRTATENGISTDSFAVVRTEIHYPERVVG